MYIKVSTHDSGRDTRPHSHKVYSDHLNVSVNQSNKAIVVNIAELDEQITGKRWIDYDPDLVEYKSYRREAELLLSFEDLNKILQVAQENGLLSVKIKNV